MTLSLLDNPEKRLMEEPVSYKVYAAEPKEVDIRMTTKASVADFSLV
ncbi:hypothetical protein GCM10009091_25100 [Pseudomonas brenneri]|nr:hypothetical protein GCM10009091_25100 [Pseudomonas brenneri]